MSRSMKVVLIMLVVLSTVSLVYGQANIGFKGIGGKVGYAFPEDPLESTISFGAVVDLGTIIPALNIGAFVDYWANSYDAGTFASWGWTEINLGPFAKYYFPMDNSKFKPFAGGGLAFTFGKAKWETTDYNPFTGQVISGNEVSESETHVGFRLLGGADYELSPGLNGYVEVLYNISHVDYFGIYVGVVKVLGQ